MSRDEAEEKHDEALKRWNELKKTAKQEREKELLELCPSEISGDTESSRKKRKQVNKNAKGQVSAAHF